MIKNSVAGFQICLLQRVLKQVLACVATSLCSINLGNVYGFSAVLLPQLKDDGSIGYDTQFDSWIASASPLSMAAGCLISGSIIDNIGRRLSLMIIIWPGIAGWIMQAYAYNFALILTGRVLNGFSGGLLISTIVVFLGEITEPKYRGMFLLSTCMMSNVGMLLCHLICRFIGWRISSLIFATPLLISFFIFIFLKESPLWLITKGRIKEGTASFEWYRGKTKSSAKELQSVIEKQKMNRKLKLKEIATILVNKTFLKPFVTSIIIFLSVQLSGLNAFVFYAQDLVLETFSVSVDSFWFMILTDVIRIISSTIISAIGNRISTRKSFLFCSLITSFVLAGMVVCLIVNSTGLLWILATCLLLYIGFGTILVSISWTFVGEIFPSSVRGLGSGISSTSSCLFLFGLVKISPSIVAKFSMAGIYTLNLIAALVGLVVLYYLLPITSYKTLQEIENEYESNNKFEVEVTRV